MQEWLKPYEQHISDTGGLPLDDLLRSYKAEAVVLMTTDAGRALAVNIQVGLLVRLRAAGLLKE